jgi:hypothetical protein
MRTRLILLLLLVSAGAALLFFTVPPGWPCSGCDGNGPLKWRSAVVWETRATKGLGGLSGLEMSSDSPEFLTLSDRVRLFSVTALRDPETGVLHGLGSIQEQTIINTNGQPFTPFNSDAEALAMDAGRVLYVGFEGLTRILAYPPGVSNAQRLHGWDRFRELWGNTGIEALAPLPGGGLVAITEPGQPFIWHAKTWQAADMVPDMGDFSVSGADLGPNGDLWLLERRFSWTGFKTRIRRFNVTETEPDFTRAHEVVLDGRIGIRDNYEGISVWCDASGQTIVTLISDDGFSRLGRTVMAELVYTSAPSQPACVSN